MTQRDKFLAMVLPAGLILLGYGGWYRFSTKSAELAATRKALDEAERTAPRPDLLRLQERQLAIIPAEIDKWQGDLKLAFERWEAVAGKCASAEERNERIERLTGLLNRHKITVVTDGEADPSKGGKLPQALENLAKQFAETAKNHKPQLRQLHLEGSYFDVHGVLQELVLGDVLAIPVGLTMKPSKESDAKLHWTLLVWI
jgi:hypothetical protein